MKSFSDLPALVTDNILAFAFSGAGGDISMWKQALPLLSVCRDWRFYGKHRLYRYAVFEIVKPSHSMYESGEEAVTDSGGTNQDSVSSSANRIGDVLALDGRKSIRVYTNIQLIETLGLESIVKQLIFGEKQPRVTTIIRDDSLKAFMSILQAMFHGLPEDIELTEPFIKWLDLVYRGSMRGNILMRQCHNALNIAVNILTNKYPNVCCISHVTLEPHEFMQKMVAELAVGYDKQLTKYVCEMPATVPYSLLAPNLVDLDLRLYTSSNQNLPAICPQSLLKIKLIVDTHLFSWKMFRIDKKFKTIVFENLEDLSIIDAVKNGVGDMIANNLNLEFPKLEKLYLANICLTGKDMQAIMGHGLKQFHHEGSIIAASNMCKQPLGTLDELHLLWEGGLYPYEADNFVPLTNEIFNKTDGIGYVHCEIRSVNFAESMVGIDWPYLTHLSLGFMMSFKALFDMVPNVPNLVYLDMNVGGHYMNELVNATELLTNIKEHYPEPSSSKIETLCLVGKHGPSCSYPCCRQPFREAIENLKWYWPQLKNIDFEG